MEVLWRYKFAKPVFTSASLLHDHSIIVGCVNGELVRLTPDGTMVRANTHVPYVSAQCVLVVCKL